MEEKIKDLEDKVKRYSVLNQTQKNEMHKFALRINKLERDLLLSYNKLDEIGGALIAVIKKHGDNNKISIEKNLLEDILPGTILEDSETEELITLAITEVKNIEDIPNISGGGPKDEHNLNLVVEKGE